MRLFVFVLMLGFEWLWGLCLSHCMCDHVSVNIFICSMVMAMAMAIVKCDFGIHFVCLDDSGEAQHMGSPGLS